MPEAYAVAASRHFADAERLARDQRYDNAGHLVGFAAECALKHAYDITEPDEASPRVHLPDLAAAIRRRVRSRNPRQQALRSLLGQTQNGFFSDWQVSARYGDDGTVSRAMYERWEGYARRTLGAARIKL